MTHQGSLFEQTGLTFNVSEPLVIGGAFVETIDRQVGAYSHEILADGGYWKAEISFNTTVENLSEWIESGLGRDVVVYNEAGEEAWAGFVNQIDANVGTLAVRRGPLLGGVANKVKIIYSTVDTSTTPPTVGLRTATAYANDTDSQAKYGIIEKVLSTGGAITAQAEQIRDTYLEENKEPETSEDLNLSAGSPPSVRLTLWGYIRWFDAYTYAQTLSGTDVSISSRLQLVITADPNSIFSSDYSHVETNSFTIPTYENDDKVAWAYIKSMVSIGDSSDNRYTFGVYEDRLVYYAAIPTSVEYLHRLTDREPKIETLGGNEVYPWDVRPAKWLFVQDFLVGREQPSTLRLDPRNLFIESVEYTAPWGLRLSGSKISRLPQILAKYGISGIGG